MGDIDTKGIIVGVGIMLMLVGNLDIVGIIVGVGIIVVVGDGVNGAKQDIVANAIVLPKQEFEVHDMATHVPNKELVQPEFGGPEQIALALQELPV